MTAQTICSNCKIPNLASAYYCKKCGQILPRRRRQRWLYILSWVGLTLFTFTLLSVTLVAIGPIYIDHPTIKVDVFQPAPKPEKPPEVGMGDEVYIPEATGSNGCKASILLYLLSDEYSWKEGYSQTLSDTQDHINFTDQMRNNINNNAAEVITIGASSEDIGRNLSLEDGRKYEEWRAGERAKTIAKWVGGLLNKPIPVRKLNVGHYIAEKGEIDNPDQRRVIVVLILRESKRCTDDTNSVDGALRDAFKRDAGKHPIYEQILTHYSLSKEDQKLTWIS